MKETKFEIVNEIDEIKAVLVGLQTTQDDGEFEDMMLELADLARACNIDPVLIETQSLDAPVQSTYVGSGKVEEIKADIDYLHANLVIFDQTLSPMQFRNLGKIFNIEVMDRTGLILKIFSEQAKTREARLQVEYANLKYLLPRLAGMWSHLGRQGGASGARSSRGEGEKQIELDRRYIEHKIVEVEKELKTIEKERATQRTKRTISDLPKVSLVGYTNAGKSTVMNDLLDMSLAQSATDKKVLQQDKLFATLDTTVRKINVKGHRPFLLSDTVGFISELPHFLVKGFRSTLEEVKHADLLLEIIDFSNPQYQSRIDVTRKTLDEIGASDIPVIYVYNKVDLVKNYPEDNSEMNDAWIKPAANYSNIKIPYVKDDSIYISAGARIGLDELLSLIDDFLMKDYALARMQIPYTMGNLLNSFEERNLIINKEYTENGTIIDVNLSQNEIEKYREFLCN